MADVPANVQRTDRSAHWQHVYQTKSDTETSWFQEEPTPSLELVRGLAPPHGRVIDIGGGASSLGGRLAELGFDVTVLDISEIALERARARAGAVADRMHWLVGDVTTIEPEGRFDVWHDRAVFHFLVDRDDRRKYATLAAGSVHPGGHLVLGTFALTGPEKCSGLAVQRYDAPMLAAEFAPAFVPVRSLEHVHVTPWGKSQAFLFAVMRRGHT